MDINTCTKINSQWTTNISMKQGTKYLEVKKQKERERDRERKGEGCGVRQREKIFMTLG